MAGTQKTFEQVLAGGVISFRDFEALLDELGFTLVRQRGSHRIYIHAKIGRPFPVQPDGRDARHYQVRQLRDMIRRHDLRMASGR
jgi:predicted RNA binding protein YcfA (HicA-like mRNA interferase family)